MVFSLPTFASNLSWPRSFSFSVGEASPRRYPTAFWSSSASRISTTLALAGRWAVEAQRGVSATAGAKIAFRFRARDLHLVLGSASGKPVRFRVSIDGKAPGADHGTDVDRAGSGQITGQRLYQLIRQKDPSRERTFEIEFLDPGAEAYAFTFG